MTVSAPSPTYRLLSLLFLPLWLIHAFWHGRSQAVGGYFGLRCKGIAGPSAPCIWVHAASVGEVEAVSPLVERLLERGEQVLFTSFTATGLGAIRTKFDSRVVASIIPIDFIWLCQRFLRQTRIKCCLLMETELWPELLYQCANSAIPIIQINARLSDKSTRTKGWLRALLSRTQGYITLHLTRNENDRRQLMQLGAAAEKIRIVGNLKTRSDATDVPENLIGRDYLLFASTHSDEEFMLMQRRPSLLSDLLIVIAPRHPTRSKAIQLQLDGLGISYAIRSQSQSITAKTEVYLADTLGEMKALMAHARIVIMGGSFDHTGGHNLIEPAALGCAIITGPDDANIAGDIQLLGDGHGVIQVDGIAACWSMVERLLTDDERCLTLGQHAQTVVEQQPDVVDAYLQQIDVFI